MAKLTPEQQAQVERLDAALAEADDAEDAEAVQTGQDLAKAARKGDDAAVARITKKAKRKGWL